MRPVLPTLLLLAACSTPETARTAASPPPTPEWEAENPVRPLPAAPLGVAAELSDLTSPRITPEKVRLGRWLFYDPRLSRDGTISCASCHEPSAGFSERDRCRPAWEGRRATARLPRF